MGTQVRNSGTKEGVAGETTGASSPVVSPTSKQYEAVAAVQRLGLKSPRAVLNPMLALVRNYVVGYHFYENRFEERR